MKDPVSEAIEKFAAEGWPPSVVLAILKGAKPHLAVHYYLTIERKP